MNKGKLKIVIASAIGISVLTGGAIYAFHGNSSKADSMEVTSSAPVIEEHDLGSTDTVLPQDSKNIGNKDEKKEDKKEEKKNEKPKEEKVKSEQGTEGTKKASTTDKKSSEQSNKNIDKHKEQSGGGDKIHKAPTATQNDWVAKLNVAKQTSQLITVQASGKTARVQFHKKGSNGIWKQEFSTDGYVGYNGITSHKREGDGKTPVGVYSLGSAFGIAGNPGTSLDYRHINNNDYWVDDVNSAHYNEWVNTSNTRKDWNSAEHMISQSVAYKYGIVINYNTDRTRGEGSGIFLHCSKGGGTAGCVAISQSRLVQLMQEVSYNARIVISSYDGIYNY